MKTAKKAFAIVLLVLTLPIWLFQWGISVIFFLVKLRRISMAATMQNGSISASKNLASQAMEDRNLPALYTSGN